VPKTSGRTAWPQMMNPARYKAASTTVLSAAILNVERNGWPRRRVSENSGSMRAWPTFAAISAGTIVTMKAAV